VRTVAVYRARRTRERGFIVLVWKLVAESGIGFEEIHYTDTDGSPVDPGEHEETGFEFAVQVHPDDLPGREAE
jgi:hypothetical protein